MCLGRSVAGFSLLLSSGRSVQLFVFDRVCVSVCVCKNKRKLEAVSLQGASSVLGIHLNNL